MGKLKELTLFTVVTVIISVFLYYFTLTGFSYGTVDKWILIAINVAIYIYGVLVGGNLLVTPDSVVYQWACTWALST